MYANLWVGVLARRGSTTLLLRGPCDDRSIHSPAARLQADRQGPLRHRGEPVRRPRRVDQHHAPDPAGDRLRGDPSRPQPLGRGDRQLRDAGRRARHRDLVVPGRPRRVLQVHARPAARARRRPHQGVRRRRRRDRPGGDRGAARLRRHADLLAGGRPEARPAGDDQRDRRRVRRRPRRRRVPTSIAALADGDRFARTRALARTITGARSGHGAGGFRTRAAARGRGRSETPGARHHRHRRRGQELADRRAGPPLPPRPAATG